MNRIKVKKKLEEIRDLALSGRYSDSLSALDLLLASRPNDINALRLKGNVLELKAFDATRDGKKNLSRSRDFLTARKCYEHILNLEPSNTLALIDLGDHYRNLDAFNKALRFYEEAMTLLEKGEFSLSRADEVEEAFGRAGEVYGKLRRNADKTRVESMQRKLIDQITAHQSRGPGVKQSPKKRAVRRK